MVLAPRKRVMHHDGLGDVRRRVAVVLLGVVAPRRKTEDRVVGEEVAVERLRVGVGKQLVPVPTEPSVRVERPVDPEPVTLTRTHTRHVAVPDVVGHLLEPNAMLRPPAPVCMVVEQADVHALGLRREQREVGALAIPGRAERGRAAGPAGGLVFHGSTSFTYDVVLALIFVPFARPGPVTRMPSLVSAHG